MSNYENYDSISETYDNTRTAVGLHLMLGIMYQHGKGINSLTVLDAGCGTGNYAKDLNGKVGRLVCADFSQGMLSKALPKLLTDTAQQNDKCIRIDLSELPFVDNSFDIIMCNQCLHHLDSPNTDFVNLRRFLTKVQNVLTDDGRLLVNTITHRQMRDGVWWAELIAPAIEKMTSRFTSDEEFERLLDEAGFYIEHRIVPTDEIIQKNGYFNHNSLRSKSFRDGDSHFTLLDDDELQEMLDRLDEYESAGEIENYIATRDKLRKQVGQFTVFSIKKKQPNASGVRP